MWQSGAGLTPADPFRTAATTWDVVESIPSSTRLIGPASDPTLPVLRTATEIAERAEQERTGLAWTVIIDTGSSRLLVCDTTCYRCIPDPRTDQPMLEQYSCLLTNEQLAYLFTLHLDDDPSCFIIGKECTMHRSMGFFSDAVKGFVFSGQFMKAVRLTDTLRYILYMFHRLTGGDFNGLLFNGYRTGEDYLSPHADKETYLSNVGVVALSLGASRRFVIATGKLKADEHTTIWTHNCEVMWMAGRFQKEFLHGIPAEKKGVAGRRLSITGRFHIVTEADRIPD